MDMNLGGSGRCWKTGKPTVLQPTGSERVRHDLVTDQQQRDTNEWLLAMITLLQTEGYEISATSLPSSNDNTLFRRPSGFSQKTYLWPTSISLVLQSVSCPVPFQFSRYFNCSITLSVKVLWHWVPQSWQVDYLISDYFSTWPSGAEYPLTRILTKGLPIGRNRNTEQGSCVYSIPQTKI